MPIFFKFVNLKELQSLQLIFIQLTNTKRGDVIQPQLPERWPLPPPKLDLGINQDLLDWNKLKVMKNERRYPAIIKRANLYNFLWGIAGTDLFGFHEAIKKAKEENLYSKVRQNIAAPRLE
jgi:hypothetical protein